MTSQARLVWVPLSVRKRMFEAMKDAPSVEGVEVRWVELEAALDAMQPFLVRILDAPESILTKPADDSDCLEDNRG